MFATVHHLAKVIYMDELRAISKKETGMHFNACDATEADLEGFELTELMEKISILVPL